MRILITGADGFAGQHLAHDLLSADPGCELHGTTLNAPLAPMAAVTYHPLNLCDEQVVAALVARVKPDQIYHLAAIANVGQSYSAAWNTLENNIHAQLNLILACLKHNLTPRMLIVSSGDIYGDHPAVTPPNEEAPFRPTNPYSVSKVTQDMLGLQYHLSNDLPILRARPFNHLGPGQSRGFVAPDFAFQIAQIENGQQAPIMHVGELSAERDFTDVRDVVRAYRLIMERGRAGAAYNIASGKTWTIRALLDTLLSYSSAVIQVQVDTGRLRPGSTPKSWGDATRLRETTGWQPTIPLQQTLLDVLQDCRQRVQTLIKESK